MYTTQEDLKYQKSLFSVNFYIAIGMILDFENNFQIEQDKRYKNHIEPNFHDRCEYSLELVFARKGEKIFLHGFLITFTFSIRIFNQYLDETQGNLN